LPRSLYRCSLVNAATAPLTGSPSTWRAVTMTAITGLRFDDAPKTARLSPSVREEFGGQFVRRSLLEDHQVSSCGANKARASYKTPCGNPGSSLAALSEAKSGDPCRQKLGAQESWQSAS
jgi:hypothetical protein